MQRKDSPPFRGPARRSCGPAVPITAALPAMSTGRSGQRWRSFRFVVMAGQVGMEGTAFVVMDGRAGVQVGALVVMDGRAGVQVGALVVMDGRAGVQVGALRVIAGRAG